jgi:hypothetical protein
MTRNNQSSGSDIGTIIQVVFITLKLSDVVNWSWWAVMSPSLVGLAFVLLAFIFAWMFE